MQNSFHKKQTHELFDLQGQDKIHQIIYLKVNQIKKYVLFPFICLITCFIILAIIKVWQKIKVYFIYDQCQYYQASHLLVQNIIIEIIIDKNERKFFFYKKVKFELNQDQFGVVSLKIQESLFDNQDYIKTGLSLKDYQNSINLYGYCEHTVEVPSLFQYLFNQLTSIFILFQYVIFIIYFLQTYYRSVIINFSILLVILLVNYFVLRHNLLKIKEMAERENVIQVLRDSVYQHINSRYLVPGDLFIPAGELVCDAILLTGQVYVNEVGLTGQNIPIVKFSLRKLKDIHQNNILYQGSKILQTRLKPLAMVLHTGFITKKGRILRKILFKGTKMPQLIRYLSYLLIEILIIWFIIYIVAIKFWLQSKVSVRLFIFQAINILGDTVTISFLTFLNFAYTFSFYRLRNNNIFCTETVKCIDSGKIKIMCFDKTGTLTKNTMKIHSYLEFQNQSVFQTILQNQKSDKKNTLKFKLFATCHTVKKIQNQLYGDQLDLCIYRYSDYQYQESADPKIISIYKNDAVTLEVLKINQFQSQFQSMSVILRDRQLDKFYIFVKGAPEKIYKSSINKPKKFNSVITDISLKGLRSLAFAYKQIECINAYIDMERQELQTQLNLLGVMTFQNQIKQDCVQLIECLREADIQIKMITGDNLYIAIETAIKSHIILENQKILVLQGDKQNIKDKYVGRYLYKQNEVIITQDIEMTLNQYLDCQIPIAIDNKFLLQNCRLLGNIKIFARALPESKASIIRKLKQVRNQNLLNKGKLDKILGKTQQKIAMVGDQINDMMAIKQADIGIGFSNTQSGISSHFTINNLIDIQYLLREGKNSLTIIVQVFRFIMLGVNGRSLANIVLSISCSALGDSQIQIIGNLTCFMLGIFILLSKPSKKLQKTIPNDNLFSFQYNLAVIIHFSLYIIYLLVLMSLLFQNPEYVPSIRKYNFWTLKSQQGTVVFFSCQLNYVLVLLYVYRSDPWKSKIWNNYILFIWWLILFIGSILMILFVPFNQASNKRLDIVNIPQVMRYNVLGMTLLSAFLSIGFQYLMRYFKELQWI